MKTLHLHIGLGKTGTSALQTWLALNRGNLVRAKYCYPDLVDLHDAEQGKPTRGNGLELALALKAPGGSAMPKQQTPVLQAAESFLSSVSSEPAAVSNAVVSSETLQFFDPARLCEFALELKRSGWRTRLICFVRSCRPFYISTWLQHVEVFDHDKGLEDILTRFAGLQMDVMSRLDAVTDAVDETLVFNYDEAQKDICSFFLSKALGLADVPTELGVFKRVNPSLSLEHSGVPLHQRLLKTPVDPILKRFKGVFVREAAVVNRKVSGKPIVG